MPGDPQPPMPGWSVPPACLVLYDTSGEWGELGELYAIQVANLVSHFGTWTTKPVVRYVRGELEAYDAVVYLGSSYGEPLPAAFLDDVLAAQIAVVWVDENVWQLIAHDPGFSERFGWDRTQRDFSEVLAVRYKGVELPRDPANQTGGLAGFGFVDRDIASVLARSVRADGSTAPWAVRTGHLTYVAEIPFLFTTEADRQLVFADLLFDALAPATPERHRGLVRLEDVNPTSDPAQLRAIGAYLARRGIPFGFAVFPVFCAPGVPAVHLAQRPDLVAAIRDLIAAGGTLVLHGYTHQHDEVANPYDGRSGSDFEFFRAVIELRGDARLVGPVPGDSVEWALGRFEAADRALEAAGLSRAAIFEFPHYAGSAASYRAAARRFAARYDRGLYFAGLLGGEVDHSSMIGQAFPYVVRDVYGSRVLPENLGSYAPRAFYDYPRRTPGEIVAAARRQLVVRDGFASFFYHPVFGLEPLVEILDGVEAAGFRFVSPGSLGAATAEHAQRRPAAAQRQGD